MTSLYRYAVEEGLLDRSPAVHVRRPRLDYESNATDWTATRSARCWSLPVWPALATMPDLAAGLNGLRVSERSVPTSNVSGWNEVTAPCSYTAKCGKHVTIPLAPRTARAVDLVVGERTEGQSSSAHTANDSIVTALHGSCGASPAAPTSTSGSDHTPSATRSSPPPWMRASHYATSKKQPATPTRAPQCVTTGHASHSIDTPPTSCPPSSPALPANSNPPAPDRKSERRAGNLARVTTLYDHPEYYDILFGWDRDAEAQSYDQTLLDCGVERGSRVLEVAAGTAQIGVRLASMGWHVTALDLSEAMLEFAFRRGQRSAYAWARWRGYDLFHER